MRWVIKIKSKSFTKAKVHLQLPYFSGLFFKQTRVVTQVHNVLVVQLSR
jgi:hypothetical protein